MNKIILLILVVVLVAGCTGLQQPADDAGDSQGDDTGTTSGSTDTQSEAPYTDKSGGVDEGTDNDSQDSDASTETTDNSEKVTVYFFWGESCPHCATEKTFLEEMENKYPELELKMFETYKDPENAKYFQKFAQANGFQARGVPATIIGEEHWVGFAERMKGEIEQKIKDCIENGCPDPGDKVN